MKKIITAINNPKLNEELKKQKNFKVVGKDIQYKEAILEVLEKNNNIDLIIVSEKILGEIKTEKLIEKIKLINEKIKIIFILEKENNEIEKILIRNNIIDIYYNNKINLNELIKIINKKEINMEEEIIKLKKIIEEKNKNYLNYTNKNSEKNKRIKNNFINKNIEKIKYKIKNKNKKSINKLENNLNKMITFSGNYKSGKSTIALMISQYLSERDYKVLLIDGDLEKQDLKTIIKKGNKNNLKNYTDKKSYKNKKKLNKKRFFNKKNKLININNKYKKLINKKNKIYYYKIKKEIIFFTIKINKNFNFYYGLENLLENKKIKKEKKLKEKIFYIFEIIKQKYNFVIIDLSKNNNDKINQTILKRSDTNFVCLEGTMLEIKECKRLLGKYIEEWKINKNSLSIIKNKKSFISMNSNLISKCLPIKNKIFEIKENKFYHIFFNQYFKRKKLLKKKNIKKELNKIINKIIFK